MSNYKIAVLGDKDSVLGFKALGAGRVPGGERGGGKAHPSRSGEGELRGGVPDRGVRGPHGGGAGRYKDALTPAIILIPGKDGSWASVWPTSSGPWSGPWARIFCSSPYAHNALGAL